MNEEDRRRFHRIHFDAPAVLTLEDGKSVESLVVDCCLKGVLVKRRHEWEPVIGGKVAVKLRLSADNEESISMDTEVSRIGDESIGLNCIHIDLESIIKLRRLVELNLGDTGLLERDLEHLIAQ